MATLNVIAQPGTSNVSVNLTSTKVKVTSNVAVNYAVGSAPVAYTTGNCAILPANLIRDINCGPGVLTANLDLAVAVSGIGPKIAFIPVPGGGTAQISVTEIGFVDFSKVTN